VSGTSSDRGGPHDPDVNAIVAPASTIRSTASRASRRKGGCASGAVLARISLEASVITELLLTSVLMSGAGQFQERREPARGDVQPAQLLSGAVPELPVVMLSGGQVFLELVVDLDGRVAGIKVLRASPPLTMLVTTVVGSWRFEPSRRTIESVTESVRFAVATPRISRVFVGAVFRSPTTSAPTLGREPAEGDPADPETPVPTAIATPPYPLSAFAGGVVLTEVRVETDGRVSDVCVLESTPPFDTAAMEAARRFRFRPAVVDGRAVPSFAYLLFGFPAPIADTGER
jgi:TonB family protein